MSRFSSLAALVVAFLASGAPASAQTDPAAGAPPVEAAVDGGGVGPAPALDSAVDAGLSEPIAPIDAGAQEPVAAVDAGHQERLAVMDAVVTGTASPALARALADVAAAEASGIAGTRAITQAELQTMLTAERQRQLLGCTDDTGCVSEVASAMEIDRVLSTEVTQIEHTTLLVVRLIDTRQSKTLARLNTSLIDASQAAILDAMKRLAHEALTGQKLDTTGVVRISVEEDGARVSLDGKDLGASPLKEPGVRVLEGPHELTVQKDGFVRWSSKVTVTAGGVNPVTVRLVPVAALTEGYRSRAWSFAYASGGVAAAAGITGTVVGILARSTFGGYEQASSRMEALRFRGDVETQSLIANVAFSAAAVAAVASAALFVTAIVSEASAKPAARAAAAEPVDGAGTLSTRSASGPGSSSASGGGADR